MLFKCTLQWSNAMHHCVLVVEMIELQFFQYILHIYTLCKENSFFSHNRLKALDEIVQIRNMIKYCGCTDQIRFYIKCLNGRCCITVPESFANCNTICATK